MTRKQPTNEMLRALLDAACNDAMTDEQFDQLETALLDSEEARREYLRYFTLGGDLRYLVSRAQADEATRQRTGMAFDARLLVEETPVRPTAPFVPLPGGVFHGLADSLSKDWTRAYLLAGAVLI